jgi:hypothetical protein
MIHGANTTMASVTPPRIAASSVNRRLARRQAASGPSRSLIAVNVGTNAEDSAPSANRSLRRFGIRKAARNASVTNPAPK